MKEKICPIMEAGRYAYGDYGGSGGYDPIKCVQENCAMWSKEKKKCGLRRI